MSDRRVLVVADHEDVGAWAAARAAASSLPDARLVVVSGDDLAASRWRHEVTTSGVTTTTVRVPGVGDLADADLAGVLYRSVRPLVPPGLRYASERERGYAASELTALVTSWLASLGSRVLSRPEGASPVGPTWAPGVWLTYAGSAGFRVGAGPTARTALVAGRRVVGATGEEEAARAIRMTELTHCRLLEISLGDDGSAVGVTCLPALLHDDAVRALADALVDLAAGGTEVAA